LIDAVARTLDGHRIAETVDLPHDAGQARAWLYDAGLVQSEEQGEAGARIQVLWSPRHRARLAELLEAAGA